MGDYAYANARLRALRSRLFNSAGYAELTRLERVDDVIAHLAHSAYAPEIDAALARFSGVRVVLEACRLHLAHRCRTVRAFFDDDGARLMRVLLARWDLHNIKTLVRGREADVRLEDVLEALVPAGDLDDAAWRVLAREPNLIAALDLLRLWNLDYARAARAAFDAWRREGDWQAFEARLDTEFYARLLSALGGGSNDALVRELLGREIDATNILTALRVRQALPDITDGRLLARLLDGGELRRSWFVGLARLASDDAVLDELRTTPFRRALLLVPALDVPLVEQALDRALLRFGLDCWDRDPLSIAPAIGYLTSKRVEVTNLRLIVQGVALGLGPTTLERELLPDVALDRFG